MRALAVWVPVCFKAFIVGSIMFTAACFKKPGSQSAPIFSTAIPITPVYDLTDATNSHLLATGSCQGNSSIEFIFSSPLTSERSVEGTCSADSVTTRLMPIDSPLAAQVFTVRIVAKKNAMRKELTVTVNYSPSTPASPGFAVVSGGGKATGTGMSVNTTVGDIGTPNTITGTGMKVRTGIQGVVDP